MQQQPITLLHYTATTNHVAALCSDNQSRCGIIQQQLITLRHTEQQPITLRHYAATTNRSGVAG